MIASDDAAAAVSWGTGALIAAGAAVWAKLKNMNIGSRLVAAGATGNPNADPKAPETVAAVQAAIADPASPIVAKASS